MVSAFTDKFLASFDDNRFPADFLKKYELMECLTHNDMGETLLVRDRCTNNHFIAKCYADQTLIPHISESNLLRNFHHARLPAFIGEYQNETMLCVVRSYVEGTPLDQLVHKNPLPQHKALAIVNQLCDILSYLHSQTPAIIHRDIKPQNIIVDDQGSITLIDFGISRTYNESALADTICFGTRHFAAPEQYGFAQTDTRTDIFAAGVLLAWLLTGSFEIEAAKRAISDRRLLGIIEKCTAFDPKDRYKNTVQLKDALTGRLQRRRHIPLATLGALLVLLAALLYTRATAGIRFKEPLIESAVRLSLNVSEDAELTEEDLISVNEIFVLGNQAAADRNAFDVLVNQFANSGGVFPRGDIDSLSDLAKLKNLRSISLAYQNYSDLSPLAELPYLELVDIRNNPQVTDISPLIHSDTLTSLIIFDTSIIDLSILRECPRLSLVDAGKTPINSMAALDGLEALQNLSLRVTPLRSLDGIADHLLLERLYLSDTHMTDLTPLLALTSLKTVEVSENMRSSAEVIADQAKFEIIYQ